MNELLFAGGPGAGGRYGKPVAAARADRGGRTSDQRPMGRPPSRRIGRSYGRAGGSLKMRGGGEAGPDHYTQLLGSAPRKRPCQPTPRDRGRALAAGRTPTFSFPEQFQKAVQWPGSSAGPGVRNMVCADTITGGPRRTRPRVATVIARQLKDLIVDDLVAPFLPHHRE